MNKKFIYELITDPQLLKRVTKQYNQRKVGKFIAKRNGYYATGITIAEQTNSSVNAIAAYALSKLKDGIDYRVARLAMPNGDRDGYGIILDWDVNYPYQALEQFVAVYGSWDGIANRGEVVRLEKLRLNAHNDLLAAHKAGNKTTEKGAAREAFIPTVNKTKAIPTFSNSYKRTLDLSVPYTVSFRIIDAPIVGESSIDRGVRLHTKYMDDYAAKSDNELTGLLRSLSDNLVAERELTTIDFGRIQTADAAGYDSEGNPVVVEFKTGKEHYEKTKSAKAQLLRYAKGMSRVANFETISMVLIYPEDGMKVETFTMTLAEVLEQYPLVCIEQGLKDIVDNNSQLVADLLATKSLGGLRKGELIELLADIKAVKRAIDIAKAALKKFK